MRPHVRDRGRNAPARYQVAWRPEMSLRSSLRELWWLLSPLRIRFWYAAHRYRVPTSRKTKRVFPYGEYSDAGFGPLPSPRSVLESILGRRLFTAILEAWGR